MKYKVSILIQLLVLQYLSVVSVSQDFDFFYLVLQVSVFVLSYVIFQCMYVFYFGVLFWIFQWPGSYCDTQQSCCYPTTGKPEADFGIHGLWPNYNDGSYPSNCDPNNPFQQSEVCIYAILLQLFQPSFASLI